MRIVLFNLNNYVGGGEVYIAHFTRYLKENNIDYLTITYPCGYLENECNSQDYNYLSWPTKKDSYIYANSLEKNIIETFFKKNFRKTDCFLLCNMRELYTFLAVREKICEIRFIQFKNILFHPEEYKYGSRFSLKRNRIENFNKNLLTELDRLEVNIYPNENARKKSIKDSTKEHNNYIPFPSFLDSPTKLKKDSLQGSSIKIITISRFVSFKISSILEIMRVVKRNNNYELTIIGYGKFKILIQLYKLFCNKRVILVDKVNPSNLHKYIETSDIGVAQGTSILQMISTGLPTIISPYSKWYDFMIGRKTYSFGVFTKNNLEFGDRLSLENDNNTDFESSIKQILSNYELSIDESLEVAKYLNSKKIFQDLFNQIKIKTSNIEEHQFQTLKPAYFRKVVKTIL